MAFCLQGLRLCANFVPQTLTKSITIMKKITSFLTLTLIALMSFSLTSCDDDEAIAYTLEGTWEGDMYVYYNFNGETYSASRSILYFDRDPYSYASGSGYWIDYYNYGPYGYYATNIEWTVVNGKIRIYSIEDNQNYYISDYSLDDGQFHGYIDYGNGSSSIEFHLRHTSSPNWNNYDWNGWGDYNSYYYYSPAKKSASKADSTAEKPVRHFGRPATK